MAKESILVVDDEQDILELIGYNLQKEGYQVTCVTSGEEAITRAQERHPDLIILDLMLPGLDGLEVCRHLKQQEETRAIPILMLTAKGEESDIIIGLELGADDYMTKPFSPKILVARIRAVLRRGRVKTAGLNKEIRINIHDIIIDTARHEVFSEGKSVSLSATEFDILILFSRNAGWVFTRNQIIDAVKGNDYFVTERAVDVQIFGLRKKLGSQGKYIQTIRGVGYRMKEG
jgi:two-component system alkaline phosphatase synthesis response regulator PhoP